MQESPWTASTLVQHRSINGFQYKESVCCKYTYGAFTVADSMNFERHSLLPLNLIGFIEENQIQTISNCKLSIN
jgi:hypothetical protein